MHDTDAKAGQHPLARLAIANLDKRRKAEGLSLTRLAHDIGRGGPGLSFIWRGERGLSLDVLDRLARRFRVPAWVLLRPDAICTNCHGTPDPGFMCLACGTTGDALTVLPLRRPPLTAVPARS
jgi:transcriptional regulator with XRE-family HTH domain